MPKTAHLHPSHRRPKNPMTPPTAELAPDARPGVGTTLREPDPSEARLMLAVHDFAERWSTRNADIYEGLARILELATNVRDFGDFATEAIERNPATRELALAYADVIGEIAERVRAAASEQPPEPPPVDDDFAAELAGQAEDNARETEAKNALVPEPGTDAG